MRSNLFTYKPLVVLLITSLLLTACTWVIDPELVGPVQSDPVQAEPVQAAPEENMVTGNIAFIQTVEIEEREGDYYATVTGWYPDACSVTDEIVQEVDGDTIHVTITSKRPADMVCAQMLTDFEEEFLLETEGLEAGEYTVIVNEDNAMTTFSIS